MDQRQSLSKNTGPRRPSESLASGVLSREELADLSPSYTYRLLFVDKQHLRHPRQVDRHSRQADRSKGNTLQS